MIHENIKKDACSNENESVLTGKNKNASVVVFFEMKTDSFKKCISGPGPYLLALKLSIHVIGQFRYIKVLT